jgi:hypothetical protein
MSRFCPWRLSDCAFRYSVLFIFVLGLFVFQISYIFAQTGRTIKGIVLDSLDEGISDASVSLHSATTVLQTTPDSKGQFEFTNLPAGEYDLTVARRGFAQQTIKGVVVGDKDPERFKIVLQPGPLSKCCCDPVFPTPEKKLGIIWGFVFSDAELKGLQISLTRIRSESQPIATQLGCDDEFIFVHVDPGPYTMAISLENGKEICSKRVKIPSNEVTKVDFRLHTSQDHTVCE